MSLAKRSRCLSRLGLVLAAVPLAQAHAIMKGINYGVAPTEDGKAPNDDFMCGDAAPQWSGAGRGDLEVIRAMGANAVRLYGNDPRQSHREFLDAALHLGLDVIPGNSDWPYTQSPHNCMGTTGYDCSGQLQYSYRRNLQRGFLREDRRYHPALSHVVAINEPDLKLPGLDNPRLFCKAVISALDGMLQAEQDEGVDVNGHLPMFTVTFSFAMCPRCSRFGYKPGLGQMWQLRDAMLNPQAYGYRPRHDLAQLYRTRFVNSFNTHNKASELRGLILDTYEAEFPRTPIFIGEYHSPHAPDQQQDIQEILSMAQSSRLLLGISFFEYMKRRDSDHMEFGLFDFGSSVVADMRYFGQHYGVRCVRPGKDAHGRSLPAQVARAFRNSGVADELFTAGRCITGVVATTSTSTTTTVTTVTLTTTSATTTSTTATTTTTTSSSTSTTSSSTSSSSSTTTTTSDTSTTTGGADAAGDVSDALANATTTLAELAAANSTETTTVASTIYSAVGEVVPGWAAGAVGAGAAAVRRALRGSLAWRG